MSSRWALYSIMFSVSYLFLVLCHQWHNICTYLCYKRNLLRNFQQWNCKQRKIILVWSEKRIKWTFSHTRRLTPPLLLSRSLLCRHSKEAQMKNEIFIQQAINHKIVGTHSKYERQRRKTLSSSCAEHRTCPYSHFIAFLFVCCRMLGVKSEPFEA